MFILINIVFYAFVPLCMLISVIGLWKNPSNWKKFLLLLGYAIFIISYTYQPLEESGVDLIRYFWDVEYCGRLSLKETIEYFNDGLFVENFLLWLVGHIGDVHLLPAISTTCVYIVACYITCDLATEYSVKRNIGWIILFQFMMIPLVSIINNVRNVFAFSAIILAAYLDIVKQKKNVLILFLYLIGCFMHLSAIFFLILRVICRLAKKSLELVIVLPFVMGPMIMLIHQNRSRFVLNFPMFSVGGSINNGIQLMIQKMYNYMIDETSDYAIIAKNSRYFRTNRGVMMLSAALAIALIFYIVRFNKGIFKQDSKILVFVLLIGIMTLSCNIFAVPNYWRFSAASYVASGLLVVPIAANYKNLPVLIRSVFVLYIAIAVIGLLLQFWFARTTVSFLEWGGKIMVTNIYTIIIKLLARVF